MALLQARYVRNVPKILRVIQPIPHQELIWCIETDEAGGVSELRGDVLVKECADVQRTRFPCLQQVHQPAQSPTGVDDVFDEQNVLSLELGFRIVQEADVAAGLRRVAVARGDQKIDLQWPLDFPDQITQKYKAPLQEAEDEKLAAREPLGDLTAKLCHSRRDPFLRVDDSANGTPEQAWIRRVSG